jgi:ferredoxin
LTAEKNIPFDIFGLLSDTETKSKKAEDTEKEQQKKKREQLLAPTRVKDLFPEGAICINKYTCVGVQCKLCIKACPTNALYWANGEIAVVNDLCVYCDACVLSCMVDNCIKVSRARQNKSLEHFSNTKDILALNEKLGARKRFDRVGEVFPSSKDYRRKQG